MASAGPMGARFDKLFEEMKKLEGVPLGTTMQLGVLGMNLNTEQTATSVTVGRGDGRQR